MNISERIALMNASNPEIETIVWSNIYVNWSWPGKGFGQLDVRTDQDEPGVIRVDNECMDRESVRKILHAWADFIADRAVFDDSERTGDAPPVDYAGEYRQGKIEAEAYLRKRHEKNV